MKAPTHEMAVLAELDELRRERAALRVDALTDELVHVREELTDARRALVLTRARLRQAREQRDRSRVRGVGGSAKAAALCRELARAQSLITRFAKSRGLEVPDGELGVRLAELLASLDEVQP